MNTKRESTALERFLRPRSAAVVGASRSAGGPSDSLLHALREYGNPHEVHLVNPGGHLIHDRQSYRSVHELPDEVDLALIMVPASAVVEALEVCAAKRFGGAIVYSAGFADESSEQGHRREADLASLARRTGLRILGPNSQGFLNLTDHTVTSFSPSVRAAAMAKSLGAEDIRGARGNVAVIAQSGGLGFSLLARGLGRGLRFSHVISTGNEVDLELQDFLEYLVDDPATDVVLMYIEGLKDPSRFQTIAARAQETSTRLVAAKVGVSQAGQRAALSHTGHIAGDDRAYSAVFDRYGVEMVSDPDEMLDVALALSTGRASRGRRVAMVSASGGSAVWLADSLAARGLDLPELSPSSSDRLQSMLPSFASTANPIDISGAAVVGPAQVLEAIADDPNVDALLLSTTLARAQRIEDDTPALAALVARADKPTVVYSYTEPHPLAHERLRELGIPLYTGISACARGLDALARAGTWQAEPPTPSQDRAANAARASLALSAARVLCEYEAKDALRAFGLTVADEELAVTRDQAVEAARRLGHPVALKVQSPDVPHKAAAGGVALGCVTAAEVADAFDVVIAAVAANVPQADVHGVLVQPMLPRGFELLVGVQNQSGLGPMMVLGLGGALVEILDRTVSYPAPFGVATARRLLVGLGVQKIVSSLDDAAALVSTISEFAAHTADLVAEIDLNPVVIEPDSGRVHLLDALIVRH